MSIFRGLSLIRRASSVLLCAAAVFHAVSVWTALCGTSGTSRAILAAAIATAAAAATRLQQQLPALSGSGGRQLYPVFTAAGLGLTCFSLLPWVLSTSLSLAGSLFPVGQVAAGACIYSLPAFLLCGVLSLLFLVCQSLNNNCGAFRLHGWLPVLVAMPAVCLPGMAGISALMVMAACVGLSIVCVSLGALPERAREPIPAVSAATGVAGSAAGRWRFAVVLCSGAAAGLLASVLFDFWGQLFPFTVLQLVLLCSVGSAMVLGIGRLSAGSVGSRLLPMLGLLLLLLIAWVQPLLPELFLAIAERFDRGLLQLLLRAVAAGGISALLFSGLLPQRCASAVAFEDRWFAMALACAIPAGLTLVGIISVPGLLPAVLGLCVVCVFSLRLSEGAFGWLGAAGFRALAPVALALLAIPLAAPRFDLPGASRLLFAGRTLEARGRGVSMELIGHTESARLAMSVPGAGGQLSVWRQSSASFEVLRSGVVTAKASSDTRIQPQAPEEVLPAIMALCNHSRPGRVLLLGDDSGALLRTCTHFPVQQILAVRTDAAATAAATEFLWRHTADRPDHDSRVGLLHTDLPLAVRSSDLGQFDVVVVAGGPGSSPRHAALLHREFYAAVHARLGSDGVFFQRLTLEHPEPELLRRVLATLSSEFRQAGVIQMLPGDFLLAASDSEDGLIHPQLLEHLQRGHVQREAAACGWDWAQIAVLPLAVTGGESGMFAKARAPQPLTVADGGALLPLSALVGDTASQSEKLRAAFAPFQQQIASAMPPGEAHEEAKRRLAALQQQVEIQAGMPDQPWTYRRSLRMEMQRSPRPPVEKVEGGKIIRSTHPLDELRQKYFVTLGEALQSAQIAPEQSLEAVRKLSRLSEGGEPLLGWFSHYEIVRLYELLRHPDPADELRHRLHLVFYAAPSDASVRPAISALQMLVEEPQLVADPAERYDLLNAVLQKLIERWEARTAWEPRSAVRVQQDVDLSVQAGRRAMEQMQELAVAAGIPEADFRQRRQFVHAALISPLRTYCEQVLAHRMKTESPAAAQAEEPDDLPLLAPATGISTN